MQENGFIVLTQRDRVAFVKALLNAPAPNTRLQNADNIRVDDLPPELVKQFKLPRYPVIGATLIGRVARDLSFRGQGIGEVLLIGALKVALAMSRKIASAAVVVDAKNDNAHRFYNGFGFIIFPETAKRLFLPMQTIEKLFSKPAASHSSS